MLASSQSHGARNVTFHFNTKGEILRLPVADDQKSKVFSILVEKRWKILNLYWSKNSWCKSVTFLYTLSQNEKSAQLILSLGGIGGKYSKVYSKTLTTVEITEPFRTHVPKGRTMSEPAVCPQKRVLSDIWQRSLSVQLPLPGWVCTLHGVHASWH